MKLQLTPFFPGVADGSAALAPTAISGAGITYGSSHKNRALLRSNGGSAMRDTLPGTGGVLSSRSAMTVINADTAGLLEIRVASGATLDGVASGFHLLGPGQSAEIESDGTNYYTVWAPSRAKLAASTTLYVAATGGSDANSGIMSTVPFATRQAAADFIYHRIDLGAISAPLTVQLAAGTYNDGPLLIRGRPPGVGNSAPGVPAAHALRFLGAGALGDVVINVNAAPYSAFAGVNFASFFVDNVKIITTGGHAIHAAYNAVLGFGTINFGSCVADQIRSENNAVIHFDNDYTISGGAQTHYHALNNGIIINTGATSVTVTGAPNFTTALAVGETGGLVSLGGTMTFTGAATGARWAETLAGLVGDGGRNKDSIIPGNANGTSFWSHHYAITCGNQNAQIATGATNFLGPTGAANAGSEATVQLSIPPAIAQTLWVHSNPAPGAGQSYTFTLRKNGVDTALTCTIADAATTAFDGTPGHAVTFASGDLFDVKVVSSAGAANIPFLQTIVTLATTGSSSEF